MGRVRSREISAARQEALGRQSFFRGGRLIQEGDAVAIKKGYHYNVAAPETVTTFLWMMVAIQEEKDGVFTTVTVQPELDGKFKLF